MHKALHQFGIDPRITNQSPFTQSLLKSLLIPHQEEPQEDGVAELINRYQ